MENERKPVYTSFLIFFKCLDLQGPLLVSLPEIMQKAQFNNEMNKILGTPGNSGELFGTRKSSCLGGIHIVDLWWDHPLASWQSDIFSLWIDFKQRIRECNVSILNIETMKSFFPFLFCLCLLRCKEGVGSGAGPSELMRFWINISANGSQHNQTNTPQNHQIWLNEMKSTKISVQDFGWWFLQMIIVYIGGRYDYNIT